MEPANHHPKNLSINSTSLSISNDEAIDASNLRATDSHRQTPSASTSNGNRFTGQRSISNESPSDLLEEDWYRLNLSASGNDTRSASKLSAKTKAESEECDERDRFSPLRFPLSLPITSNVDFENIENNTTSALRRPLNDSTRVSSKEEKQRQNEEIVIMESSSVSSETGSWESVFPHRTEIGEPSNTCESFLNSERRFCAQSANVSTETPNISDKRSAMEKADTPVQSPENLPAKYVEAEQTKAKSTSCGACFIDASTLLDDGELMFTHSHAVDATKTFASDKHNGAGTSNQSNCELKNDDRITRRNSDERPPAKKREEEAQDDIRDQDETEIDDLVINLSDEQKLSTKQARDIEPNVQKYDIKDQYSSDVPTKGPKTASGDYCARSEISKNSNDRHENERKQGHILFQNSIQQFSGHVMSPKVAYLEENNSDFSLPSVYSGSSDPYNDCASAFDTSSHHSSNYGDRDRDSHDYADLTHFSIGNSSKADSVIYPDTPHNSILQVNLSRNSIGPSDSAIASLSSSESNGISIPLRRSHDDCVPIVSGGASVKDFTPKQCESPLMLRKSENCPIISLGTMSSLDYVEPKPKPKERSSSVAMNSWVVDMSDCGNKKNRRRGSESSSVSTESSRFSDSKVDRSGSGSSHKGLGFYVSLSDMKPPRLAEETLSKSLNYHSSSSSCASAEPKKKSTGFFVDFSNSDSATNTPPISSTEQAHKNDDKKNMFSMFIDFGSEDQQSRSTPRHLAKSLPNTDSPILARRHQSNAIQTTIASDESKRHSWGTSKHDSMQSGHVREHKRSISTSSEKGIMNILDKIPLISKTSSMSIDTPNSPYDDITCSKSMSSYSNNSLTSLSVHSSGSKTAENDDKLVGKRRQKDVKINETFDKSSQGSLTDGILSKNSSPTSNTDTEDVTFHNENDETLHASTGGSNAMETIPETREAVVLRRSQASNDANCKVERHTMETLQATIEKQKQLLNTVSEEPSPFVKLSDMDKPVPKFELHNSDNRPKSVGSRIGKLFDNRAGNRNTWHHMSKSAGNNLTNLASSAENFKSLTRIFPHLGKDLSNSLPTNFDQSASNTSPNEYTMDLFHSDFSTSSATSSISRSGIDSADEFSLSAMQPRRLGEDLLKMFLQEIATDVVIEVNGRRMRAHKCILRSRCQYFAAILAGGWVESAGNVISLSGYSYGAVHFALCHIYSGAAHPPEGISLMELAALADLLGLEGLKEVAAHSLKTNYCHSFHKPCSGCIDGVMQVFPVALNQGLDDLYRKCLRWACKHYMKVWPSRSFSQLPTELVARCKQHIIAHMTSESVIYTLLDCDHLLALLAPCRWATGVESNVRDIIEAGHIYITDHFASLIASDGFLSLGQGQSWNISRLENLLLRAASSLTPDQACRSYQRITRLNTVLNAKINKLHTSRIDKSMFLSDYDNEIDGDDEDELDWNSEFIRLVSELLVAVEQCLVRQCSRAMKCNQWQRMDVELQKKAQKLACLSEPAERRISSRPKPVTYSPSTAQSNRAHDLYQVKMAIQAHSKRSQDGQTANKTQPQTITHEAKPIPAAAKVAKSSSRTQVPDLISTIKPAKSSVPVIQTDRKTLAVTHRRSASETNNRHITKDKSSGSVDTQLKRQTFRDVKSRYLEPKRPMNPIGKDTAKIRALSSSGSSRTSSPVTSGRNRDGSSHQLGKKALSDSITMSRDSLASPAKRSDKLPPSKNVVQPHDHERLSIDSLGGSMHSSVITNKTISQESLVKQDSRKSTDINLRAKEQINHLQNDKQRPMHSKIDRPATGKSAQFKVCSSLISQASSTVNSSTPSSATVKSHLSSSNSINSPREVNIKKRLTTPANQIPLTRNSSSSSQSTTKSFLSARSRQILAQKKSLSHSDSSKSVPAVIKDAVNATSTVNKSSSTSNILNRRSGKTVPTTLHLRRSAKLTLPTQPTTNHSLMNPTKSSALKMVAQNNKLNKDNNASREKESKSSQKLNKNRSAHEYGDEPEYDKVIKNGDVDSMEKNGSNEEGGSTAPICRESKLERSSTFCKDRSEIPTSELQIID